MGSKARIAKNIFNKLEQDIKDCTTYVEPFAGGMNMITHVSKHYSGKIIACDSNIYLIAMWQALQNGWTPPEYVSREMYQYVRDNKEEDRKLTGWVGFNCSYSGKWFGGFAGITETAKGVRNYQEEAYRNIIKQLDGMKNVEVIHGTYTELCIPDNAVVYCDPPYAGTTQYKDEFDSDVFFEWARCLSTRCKVFISEYNAPADFLKIWEKELKSSLSINSTSGSVKKSIESLYIYNNKQ